MKNPLLLGKRCERIPNEGGCQSALPADANTKAASINKYVGEIATRRYPNPINPRLNAKACHRRCWNKSPKNPQLMLVIPLESCLTASSRPACMGERPNAVYMAGIRTRKLRPYMCSNPCVEIRLVAMVEFLRLSVVGYPVSSLVEVMLYTCLTQSKDTVDER